MRVRVTANGPAATRRGEEAGGRVVLLALVVFLLGLAGGGFAVFRLTKLPEPASEHQPAGPTLSGSTKTLLQGLDAPVKIRLYAVLDPATLPPALIEFTGRLNPLLAEYGREANGKIEVTTRNTLSDSTAAAAAADGLKPFNLDKGDACYLGIVVETKGRKELLSQLSPEWEQALEPDLSRLIARLSSVKPPAGRPGLAPQPDTAALDEVKRALPNWASVSVEEGTRMLREKALADFGAATRESEAKVKAAEQSFAQAERDGAEAARQAALKELQQARAAQADKLQQIAARLQAQLSALDQLKRK
jgi:hypothetical protein